MIPSFVVSSNVRLRFPPFGRFLTKEIHESELRGERTLRKNERSVNVNICSESIPNATLSADIGQTHPNATLNLGFLFIFSFSFRVCAYIIAEDAEKSNESIVIIIDGNC